jgi:Domain of unknown function (DUF4124)
MRAMVLAAMSLALFCRVLMPTPAAAQQIVKWTDESGQVHYSDHAPPGATTAKVTVQKGPKAPETDIASPATAPIGVTSQSNGSGLSPAAEAIHAADEARRRELADRQKRYRDAQAAAFKQEDKQAIDRCNANRETYCKQGADVIREREQFRASLEYANSANQRDRLADRGIHTPYPGEPPHVLQRTKVCVKDKCTYEGPLK